MLCLERQVVQAPYAHQQHTVPPPKPVRVPALRHIRQLRAGIHGDALESEVSRLLFGTDCRALPTTPAEAPEGMTIGMPREVAGIITQEQ